MTSRRDVTILMTTDGSRWAKDLSSSLEHFSHIKHTRVNLDELVYDNPPEVTSACRHSPMLVFLATSKMMTYMLDKAGWFSSTLKTIPTTSVVVVILFVERQQFHDVIKDCCVTSSWHFYQIEEKEGKVEEVLTSVVTLLNEIQNKKSQSHLPSAAQEKTILQTPSKERISVELIPAKIYEVSTVPDGY